MDACKGKITVDNCRLCLAAASILKSMFHCTIGALNYAEIYQLCTGYIVKENPHLPHKICSDCETKLITLYNFRLKAESVEERLHACLPNEQLEESNDEQYYNEDFLIEAIDETIKEEDGESIDDEKNQETQPCCFVPLESNPRHVSCKLHNEQCELAMTVNQEKQDKPISLTCECGIVLKNRRSLLKHYSSIHNAKTSRMSCSRCNETFTAWRTKMAHEANVHGIGLKFSCSNCDKKFYRSDHWKEHEKNCRRVIESEKFFACSVCLFTFQREDTYSKHLETAHVDAVEGDEEYLKRADEYAKLHSTKKLENDKDQNNGEPTCEVCCKVFKNEVSLAKHTNLFHSSHAWPCEKCDAVFVHRSTKLSHMSKEHGAKKPFECYYEDCKFSCFKRDRFTAHIEKHKDPDKKFACPICQQEFKSYNTMTLHRARHSTKNTFVCPTCSKQFLDKRNYNVHLKLHTGENLHHCPTCDRGFNRKDHLQKHQQRKQHFEFDDRQ